MCEMVGTVEVCTECNTAGQVPINGTCTLHSDSKVVNAGCKKTDGNTNVGDTDKTCSKCDAATYFLYKGGCYSKDAAPGNAMCTAVSPNGVCSQAAEGYFVPPGADATHDSVVSCGDSVTGVTIDNKQYKGVASCEKCDASKLSNSAAGNAECTKCVENKYLTTAGACGEGCTEGTQFSTETTESGKKCFDCSDQNNGVDGCEKCTAPSEPTNKPTCTKCSTKYLKTAADGTTTCVEKTACKDDFFPVDDSTNGHKCVSCGDETGVTDASNKKWNGVANCTKCTQPSAAGTAKCTACASGFNLEGETCVSASANRSGLSTGAIAGISVAAVVVVGGLVGFLCWWFVYHSKKKYVPA